MLQQVMTNPGEITFREVPVPEVKDDQVLVKTITCYDRMIIQGYIPNWSHAEAMTAYIKLNGIRIFYYATSLGYIPE